MKAIKVALLTFIVTLAFCLPVFAQEVTDPKTVIKEETFNANEELLIEDFHKMEVWRCENYVEYLDGVIFNLNETVRIKKEIVDNYVYLSQFNPAFRDKIPQAQADYEDAVEWVNAYKAYKELVKADLKARYKY